MLSDTMPCTLTEQEGKDRKLRGKSRYEHPSAAAEIQISNHREPEQVRICLPEPHAAGTS